MKTRTSINVSDETAARVARCFIDRREGFGVYVEYCVLKAQSENFRQSFKTAAPEFLSVSYISNFQKK